MKKIDEEIIMAPFMIDKICHCGLCGGKSEKIKFISKIAIPQKHSDYIPICDDCKKSMQREYNPSIEKFRGIISSYPISNFISMHKHECAIRFGMPKPEKLNVVFYFEKLTQ